ncbi:MAG: hypothetical protein RMM98_01775 [Acidobacteriota bacterium]|nr:hypothetical protein [Blastocatellia bacterium]MDW8238316.1 hypothetical protein [Acidobacteriota bacterium]
MNRMLSIILIGACLFIARASDRHEQGKENKILSYFPVSVGRPNIPDKYKVTSVEQLLPGTRYYLEHATQLKQGEQVLILDDSRVGDPLITEAWAKAARERGAIVDVVTLDLTPHREPPEVGPMGSEPTSWWPTWLEHAIMKADVTLVLTPININHGIRRQTVETKWNRGRIGLPGNIYTREQLAFTKWTTFPAELDVALQRKLYDQTDVDDGPKVIRITDPLGTDLTFTQDVDREWVRKSFAYDLNRIEISLTRRVEYMFHHNKIAPGLSRKPDGRGLIVTTSLPSGPISPMKLHIEGGQIVKVEGNDPIAEEWRRGLGAYKDVDYGFPHGRGVAWLEGVYIGTCPKVIRPDYFTPTYFVEQGSYNYWWCEIKRSGFIHIGFGKGWSGLDGVKEGLPTWHHDVFLPFPTVTVNGQKIVDNGHLMALDDAEIRRIAAKYGNPDELLREEWIPAYEADPSIKGYYTQEQYNAILKSFKRL